MIMTQTDRDETEKLRVRLQKAPLHKTITVRGGNKLRVKNSLYQWFHRHEPSVKVCFSRVPGGFVAWKESRV